MRLASFRVTELPRSFGAEGPSDDVIMQPFAGRGVVSDPHPPTVPWPLTSVLSLCLFCPCPGPGHVFQPGQPLGSRQHPPRHHPRVSRQPLWRRALCPHAHVTAGGQPDVPFPKERRPGGDWAGAEPCGCVWRRSGRRWHGRRWLHPGWRRRHWGSL